MNDAISLISTMGKILEYAQSKSETSTTRFSWIKNKAGRLVLVSEDRKNIDKLAKELEHSLSLLNVIT